MFPGAFLDLPTIIITTILIEILFSAIMLLYGKKHETYPGFTIWGIQLLVLAFGQIFSLFRGIIPDLISVIGSNLCNILGMVLTYEAASRICTGKAIKSTMVSPNPTYAGWAVILLPHY